MLYLVDMSNNNGTGHDFVKAKKEGGIAGAVFKCTEGTTFVDGTFQENWNAAKKAGLVVGAYHYAQPHINSAMDEAIFFLKHRPTLTVGNIVALDIEVATQDTGVWVYNWCSEIADKLGFAPMVYASLYFVRTFLQDTKLSAFPLWLADWGSTLPASAPPWGIVALWQYSSDSIVPGINGLVDKSCLERSLSGLKQLGKRHV